ncbi:hypothetical protein [Streptomyces herbicida]|nr:hypothetical protein [Streptomyces sp. NEAU-HV9]
MAGTLAAAETLAGDACPVVGAGAQRGDRRHHQGPGQYESTGWADPQQP